MVDSAELTDDVVAGDFLVADEDFERAVREHAADAEAALAAVQFGVDRPLTAAGLEAAAAQLATEVTGLWLSQLRRKNLLAAFTAALRARGVPLDVTPAAEPFGDHATGFDRFEPAARAFRCRVLVGDRVVGSGCLIGPRLVLTAWHVIAVQAPGRPQEPASNLRVRLSDGTVESVRVPPHYESFCGDSEFLDRAPRSDGEVIDRNDVAVLLMRRPAGMYLGRAQLPRAPRERGSGLLVLVHFPSGEDKGIGYGRMKAMGQLTARWRHDITTLPGSSGGACFDHGLELVGLHQGRYRRGGRLVPLARFLKDLLPLVDADVAPPVMWSLDGTAGGTPVIGRTGFFEAIAAAGDDAGPVRGVRVKRRDVAGGGTAGLAFSWEILQHLLARQDAAHAAVRVGFDEVVPDLVAHIRGLVAEAGLPLGEPSTSAAVASDAAAPEGTARDRAMRLVEAVGEAAGLARRLVWFFLDNPSVTVSEQARLVLDGFVAAALGQPRIRLVITGFETVALPGQEFRTSGAAADRRSPGLVVDYIGGFTRLDVVNFLREAARALQATASDNVLQNTADLALQGLPADFGFYRDDDLKKVANALRPQLLLFESRARSGGRP